MEVWLKFANIFLVSVGRGAMDEATKAKLRDLMRRAEAMREVAAKKPHLAGLMNEQAARLEAEADHLRRKHPELDNDDAPPGD